MDRVLKNNLVRIDDYTWEILQSFRPDMRVPARIFVSEKLLESIGADRSLNQIVNTATLPGVVKYVCAMPDMHEGYGFPIGGVVALKKETGIISPGGVGYDINCGVRMLVSTATFEQVKTKIKELIDQMFRDIPIGLGAHGGMPISESDLDAILNFGASHLVRKGIGTADD